MSCVHCRNYPSGSHSAIVYDWDGVGNLLLDIRSGGFAPVLRVNEYVCGINAKSECLGKAGIRYCPWCGRDLLGSDEAEPDEEPDECEEPDEEPDATATPDYYTAHGVEAIDVIEAVCNRAQLAPDDVFCLGNILKYALRAGRKGGTEADFESDCAKAANYAHRMVADGWLDQDGGAA